MVSGLSTGSIGDTKDHPSFDNAKDEALYWKSIAQTYLQKLTILREEFDDYQEGSRELEVELEAQIEQYEQRVSDLLSTKCKLEEENSSCKEKLETTTKHTVLQITQLQDENVKIKTERQEMSRYIRELEQSNDDLERSKRATLCSLEEFNTRLNNAIERNVFLENELEDKEQLVITIQRLKDESRDLKNELATNSKEKVQPSIDGTTSHVICSGRNSALSSKRSKSLNVSPKEASIKNTSLESLNDCNTSLNTFCSKIPLSKSKPAKISALNIVSELIRKVGDLESKLSNCKNISRDHLKNGRSQKIASYVTSQTEKKIFVKSIASLNSRKKSCN